MKRLLVILGVTMVLIVGPAYVDISAFASPAAVLSDSQIPLEWLGVEVGADSDKGESVTWFGDHHTGRVHVLWASSGDVEVTNDEGSRLVPEFVGRLGDKELEDMAARLQALGLAVPAQLIASADAHIPPGALCHTHLNPPLWTGGLGIDAIGASSNQHCISGSTNWIEGKLQRKTVWPFYSTRDSATDGWQASATFVSMAVDCNQATPRDWRNLTNGKVLVSGSTFSVTLTSGWDSLGCVD